MKKYLIDTSVFLQAQKTYYSFEFCPGFWDWIQEMHLAGLMHSIQEVKDELDRKQDHVQEWSEQIDKSFFLPNDEEINNVKEQLQDILLKSGYQPSAIKIFSRGADAALIAYGKKHYYTVVTQEKTTQIKKLKIPIACAKFGVKCQNIHAVLRDTHPALTLDGKRRTLGTKMREIALLSLSPNNHATL